MYRHFFQSKCLQHFSYKFFSVIALILFLNIFVVASVEAAETKTFVQSAEYLYKGGLIDAESWIADGNLSVNHMLTRDTLIDNMCVGDTINFSYDPEIVYNATGGAWDTPYGDWCDNTEKGCDIDMAKNGHRYQYITSGPPYDGWIHWTGIKPSVNMTSDDERIVKCSGMKCAVVGEGPIKITANIGKTETMIWSVIMELMENTFLDEGKIFGMHHLNYFPERKVICKNEYPLDASHTWENYVERWLRSYEARTATASFHDGCLFVKNPYFYLSPTHEKNYSSLLWVDRDYERSNPFGKNKIVFDKLERNQIMFTDVIDCSSVIQCGTKHNKEGFTWEEITGTKCSDTSSPVITQTDTGWTWTCGANTQAPVQCNATRIEDNLSCGSTHLTIQSTKPTTNLCVNGSPGTVTGTGPWTWGCANTKGRSVNCWTLSGCGDGIVQSPEQCDDGNKNNEDGCTNECKWFDTCTEPPCDCGNGRVEAGEECDDGNTSNIDSCTNECKNAFCGDTYIWNGHEQCDDGNENNEDGCTNSCQWFDTCEDPPCIDGECGSSANKSYCNAPTTNLCNEGVPTSPRANGYNEWEWKCSDATCKTIKDCSYKEE